MEGIKKSVILLIIIILSFSSITYSKTVDMRYNNLFEYFNNTRIMEDKSTGDMQLKLRYVLPLGRSSTDTYKDIVLINDLSNIDSYLDESFYWSYSEYNENELDYYNKLLVQSLDDLSLEID